MKYILPIVAAFLLAVPVAKAQNATAAPTTRSSSPTPSTRIASPTPIRTQQQTKQTNQGDSKTLRATERTEAKAALELKLQEKKIARQAKLNETRKAKITMYFNQMVVRLNALISRLEILIERINSRVTVLTGEGQDMSAVEAELVKALELLEGARVKITTAQEQLNTTLEAEDPKTAFVTVRNTVKEIKDDLKEVHSILVKTIGTIKGLRVGNTTQGGTDNLTPKVSPAGSGTPVVSPSVSPGVTGSLTPTDAVSGTVTPVATATAVPSPVPTE